MRRGTGGGERGASRPADPVWAGDFPRPPAGPTRAACLRVTVSGLTSRTVRGGRVGLAGARHTPGLGVASMQKDAPACAGAPGPALTPSDVGINPSSSPFLLRGANEASGAA